MLNEKISHFYYTFIDYNIWQIQRAYYFAFWIGILYTKNLDCISEIEKILTFSRIYGPFSKIVNMLNNKVKRAILNSDISESDEIFRKMNEFEESYIHIEKKINLIIKF